MRFAGLLLLVIVNQVSAQVGFAPAANYPLYAQPSAVAAADVNADGMADLISVNASIGTLTVLTNNGNGGFGSNATYTVGIKPVWVTAVDLNGDGKVDLVSANAGTGANNSSLAVLTNDGLGNFVLSSVQTAVGSRSYAVVVADVNGDAKLDLISANALTPNGTFLIFTNNGTGGFAFASSPAAGKDPLSLVAADVNGDNWVDLISANYDGHNLAVLTNDGSGNFTLASLPNVGALPISIVAADVNGDGQPDLISANSAPAGGNSLSVLINNGSGNFAPATNYPVGSNPCAVLAADMNGDGKIDLISANFVDSTFSVLTNNGSGSFALALSSPTGASPRGAVATDINGDGRADLISANFFGASLSVLIDIPTLSIKNSGDSVVVSWPAAWTNWTLLQNTNPAMPNWSASGGVDNDGTNNSLTLPRPADSLYFRLSGP